MRTFQLHPEAYSDLDEIWEYLALRNVDAADRVVEAIYRGIQKLVLLPHQGHSRPDLTSRPLRFVRCFDYLIAYAPDERPLWVIAVVHGSRDPRVVSALLGERQQ